MRLISASGVDVSTYENRNLIGKLSMAKELMSAMCKDGLDSCYVGLPQGILLIVDKDAGSKLDEKGNPVRMDPSSRPWYKGAVEKGGFYFTDLERDYFTGKIGVTCSYPIYIDGSLAAVVAADLFLDSFDSWVSAPDTDTEFFFVVDNRGQVVFTAGEQKLIPQEFLKEARDLRESDNPELAESVRLIMEDDEDVTYIIKDSNGREFLILGSTMDTVDWSVLTVIDREAALSIIPQMTGVFDRISDETSEEYDNQIIAVQTLILIVLLLALLFGIVESLFLGKRISDPLVHLTKYITQLRNGDFVFNMDEVYRTKDEIEVLAQAFEDLSTRNQHYIKEVTRITAEKERIGAELDVATHIQADMLPSVFPPYPEKTEFDLYATMHPAKEVGGDFYDFFLVDDDHLALVVADVSGKGVPAALFMVVAKTLIKNRTLMGGRPSDILHDVNNQLSEGNKMNFFVTVWLAIIDIRTGEGIASNAGHEHPAIKKAGKDFNLVKYKHSPAVAMMEDMIFPDHEFKLDRGDRLFMYTDGVVEASNSSNELFEDKRMLDALNSDPDVTVKGLLDNVNESISNFVGDAQQFDDITMLCLEYKGTKEG